MITSKIWGRTEMLVRHGAVELHRLEANRGGRSSIHNHDRINFFSVEAGQIVVELFAPPGKKGGQVGPVVEVRQMGAGERVTVGAGVWHRFTAISDAVVYEGYWGGPTTPLGIDRKSNGAILTDEQIGKFLSAIHFGDAPKPKIKPIMEQ